MMEGMPDSVSAAYSMTATTFLLAAYSVRYTAAHTPSGSTTASVVSTMQTVLMMSGRMPMVSSR